MNKHELIPLIPPLVLIIYAFPHLFHIPVKRIPFFDTNVSATSITSLMLLYIITYILLRRQPLIWRFIATITLVESAFITYEAVHSSLYYIHHLKNYNPDWMLKMIIFSAMIYGLIYIIQKCRKMFLVDLASILSFTLFILASLYQVINYWYVSPIDDLSCILHQTIGFWMWLSIIEVK